MTIRRMIPDDAARCAVQATQRVQLGRERPSHMTREEAESIIVAGEAWACERDGHVAALMGIAEDYPGVQGVAWALLSEGIGAAAHLEVTRHARRRIAASPLVRVQALVRASVDAECAWALLVGMKFEAVLHAFGAKSEDHALFARVRMPPTGSAAHG